MDLLQALILGTIQGLTEFLPVSSSGHLVLFQNIFGLNEPELLFDIFVHIGTLLAVFVVFFPEIKSIISTLIRLPASIRTVGDFKTLYLNNEEVRICVLIVLASIPTALLGLLLSQFADLIFANTMSTHILTSSLFK